MVKGKLVMNTAQKLCIQNGALCPCLGHEEPCDTSKLAPSELSLGSE